MKKIGLVMIIALMVAGVSSVAKAQDPQQQGQRQGGRGMQMLLTGITLDSAQKVKVDSIQAAYREKNQGLIEAARGGDQDARQKIGANRQQQMADIRGLLTDEQKTTFDKNVEDMRARMSGGGRPPAAR